MVVGNVAENGADERESLDAVLHEAVRTDFHKTVFASAFDHFGHHAIQPDTVGRRMGRFALFGIDAVGYGRNQSHLISQPAEQPVQQRRRRGFPVGSGYTHQFQITARMSVKGRRDAPQRNRRIRHPHIGHPTAQLFRQLFAYYRRRSETDGRPDKAMSVGLRSAHGENSVPGFASRESNSRLSISTERSPAVESTSTSTNSSRNIHIHFMQCTKVRFYTGEIKNKMPFN